MSGIFGVIRGQGEIVDEAELAAMAGALKHRGPDGIRYSAERNVGMGHCMLHSTPESLHEMLPFRDEAAGLLITADARIDNREQLMADIPVQPASGEIISDSQFILLAYMKWGNSCVDHLLGDFAFVIWDECAQSLFFARDHMGCKPFYYYQHEGTLVFASSALAIAQVEKLGLSVDQSRCTDFFLEEMEGLDERCSFFKGVFRLPPAHFGVVGKRSLELKKYWSLEETRELELCSDAEYLDAFSELYSSAVRVRMRCHERPASMLSGGLDSSTIVAIARDHFRQSAQPELYTVSGVSEPGVSCPETVAIKEVVEQGCLHSISLCPSEAESLFPDVKKAYESIEDPFDQHMIMPSLMFLLAARNGNRVVLDGVDGDLAVGMSEGYISYILREFRFVSAWNEAVALSRHYYRGKFSALYIFFRAVRAMLTPGWLRKIKQQATFSARYKQRIKESMLSPVFTDKTGYKERYARLGQCERNKPIANLREAHIRNLHSPYVAAGLERYERVASYCQVDARHPLFDKRLLEFCVALPMRFKVSGGWSKLIMRQFAESRLPAGVAWREGWEQLGWSFGTSYAQWWQESTKISAAATSTECSDETSAEHCINQWSIVTITQWLRRARIGDAAGYMQSMLKFPLHK